MNTYIYFHVCCLNTWKDIFKQLIAHLKESGLYSKVTEIRCNVLTTNNQDIYRLSEYDPKIKIIGASNNLNLFETPTLNLLYEHSQAEDFNVLYIHTKGVRHTNNPCITDWVKYLTYFNIYRHDICMEELANYDAVGVNLQDEPRLHFSGNFWWSKSQYIRKLGKCNYTEYNSPEFWLTEQKVGNYLSLWLSNINHYATRYEEDKYKDKIVNLNVAKKFIAESPVDK
jgi:hypothetical protein